VGGSGYYWYTERKNRIKMENRLQGVEKCNHEQALQLDAAKCLADMAQETARKRAEEAEQLKIDFHGLRVVHHTVQKKLESVEDEVSSLKIQDASLQKRLKNAENEVAVLKASEDGLRSSLAETKIELASVKLDAEGKANEVNGLSHKLKLAEDQILDIKANAVSDARVYKENQETIMSLKKENGILEARLLGEKSKMVQAKESFEAKQKIAQKELVGRDKEIDGLKTQCEASKTKAWQFKKLLQQLL